MRARHLRLAACSAAVILGSAPSCDRREPLVDSPCAGLCVEVLQESPREPYVVSFDVRLRDTAGSIKDGVAAEHFTIFENDQALDLSETNQFVRSGEGLPLKIMLVLDYTNSMAQVRAISPMITAAESFVEPSPFGDEDDMAVIRLLRSSDPDRDRILVSGFAPADCDTRERLAAEGFELSRDEALEGRFWDALRRAVSLLTEQESRNRVVLFMTDGKDALDADARQTVVDEAVFAGTRLVAVGFGNLLSTATTLRGLAEDTGGIFVQAETIEGPADLPTALLSVSRYLRDLRARSGPLNVVLLLDFTIDSASQADISGMIDAVQRFVQPDHFNGTQRIGVVEFHDRTPEGAGYTLAVEPTAADCRGRARIVEGIPRQDELEHGQTRLWDAVNLGLDELLVEDDLPDARLALVFLTDGNDTTSAVRSDVIRRKARDNRVAMYAIDFGEVTEDRTAFEDLLQSLAEDTGGQYFRAEQTADLQTVFRRIAEELRGQWNLTYITQKNGGSVDVSVEFNWLGQQDAFDYRLDASGIEGPIHEGVLEVFDPAYDEFADLSSFRVRANYVPRNVNRFRLFLPQGARLQLQGSGGLTPESSGWLTCRRNDGACIEITRLSTLRRDEDDEAAQSEPDATLPGEPLHFGASGNIGTITVPGRHAVLAVRHDDRVYLDLPQPKTMRFTGAYQPLGVTASCDGPCEEDFGAGNSATATEGSGAVDAAAQSEAASRRRDDDPGERPRPARGRQ